MLPGMSTHEQSLPAPGPIPRSSAVPRSAAGDTRVRIAALLRSVKLQLVALLALAGTLNLWALSRNGWANYYYAAAVRSMSSSWHDFLFASMDRAGVMTVDKPPLALWVQALSVRVFGYDSLSILVPQALMGMASVALVYDLVRRRFGRLGGFVAGLALALTPITVGISRHNNPDALLVLCCIAALWCTLQALEGGRVRWLVLAGACVGLGFETKMGVALMVVPGIVAAWLWIAPHGRKRALGELLGAGGVMALIGGAWPALVELTPAADRPWVSGTNNNTIWQLITEYNGAGRLDGQTGGPAGMGGNMFGGTPGPLRLLNSALGGQAGWLLGFAIVSGLAVLVASRLRRHDPRSGWLIAVGGAFVVVAVVFSEARGIFHPYYVSLLAPFAAMLTGAGVAQLRAGGRLARVMAPPAIVAGVVCEVVVLHDYPGELRWLAPVLIVVGAGATVALIAFSDRALRTTALCCAVTALLIAPAIWAVDTLGYATNGTFPQGGPQSAASIGGGPGGGGGFGGAGFRARGAGAGGSVGRPQGGPPGGGPPGGPDVAGGPGGSGVAGGPGGIPLFGSASSVPSRGAGPGAGPGGGGGIGAPLGNSQTISEAIAYARSHGGGTVAVASQSSAATEIVDDGAEVAGIGGFSGRESDVSVAWLAGEVSRGQIRWVLVEGSTQSGPRLPGDTRQGSTKALEAAARACTKVTLSSGTTTGSGTTTSATGTTGEGAVTGARGGGQSSESSLYDCSGRAAELLRA
jgi:4-amino-4-deoxy-L-arabinose transferase-like glycosyltransferase